MDAVTHSSIPNDRGQGPSYALVAIASSAGGLTALRIVIEALPENFGAALIVVQHLDPTHPSHLADIMRRYTRLDVRQAAEDDAIEAGRILIAPPGHHLVISPEERVHLTDTKLVHFVRPSADLLFESAASVFGRRLISVVLTGTGVDGSAGVSAVKRHGGIVIAQDEASSEFYGMPQAAAATGDVDYILPLDEIAGLLMELVGASDD